MSKFQFDKFDLTGKVAVCAGGSSGIGLQFAKGLASAGADVVLVARRVEKMEKEAAAIAEQYGVKAGYHFLDMTKPETITKAVEDIVAEYGRIDILSNSSGIPCRNVAEECTYEEWMLVLDNDLNGPFWLAHECVRLAMKPQMYGKIINIASIHGLVGRLGYNTNAYCASKGGIAMLSKSLACEWAKYNITVNCICPGYFPSELTQAYCDPVTPEFKKVCETYSPMGRPGITGEMDGLMIYLASDASSFTTGQVIACDGGWTAL